MSLLRAAMCHRRHRRDTSLKFNSGARRRGIEPQGPKPFERMLILARRSRSALPRLVPGSKLGRARAKAGQAPRGAAAGTAVNRRVLVAVCAVLTIAVFLSLRACFQAAFLVEPPTQPGGVDNSVVALSDGSVMIAKPGTIARDVIDWFNDPTAGPRRFDIGRQPFFPKSDRPEPEAEVRLARFATELRANPDVNATIFVCGSGRSVADRQLALKRADRLEKEFKAQQIGTDRVSAETCIAKNPGGTGTASEEDGQLISIALSRGG